MPTPSDVVPLRSAFDDDAHRRWWLLCKALECGPLDRAVELARAADDFLMVATTTTLAVNAVDPQSDQASPDKASACIVPARPATAVGSQSDRASLKEAGACGRARISLSSVQREKLLDRLTKGAKNSELAAEFGLTSRQIQGVRMGTAREIAKRRELIQAPSGDHQEGLSATIDDLIRFVRQQDDVVVPEGNDEFLINGRFRVTVPELLIRANRMRLRQGKPLFVLAGSLHNKRSEPCVMNGHAAPSPNGAVSVDR